VGRCPTPYPLFEKSGAKTFISRKATAFRGEIEITLPKVISSQFAISPLTPPPTKTGGCRGNPHQTSVSHQNSPPLPVRGSGRIGTPRRFWFFFRKKEQSFLLFKKQNKY
jgi:hypothetical protein